MYLIWNYDSCISAAPASRHDPIYRIVRQVPSAEEILQADTPREAKAIGRRVSGFSEAHWKTVREEIVGVANDAKYRQNPDLKKALLATRGTQIVEASPYDAVWGIGLKADDPRSEYPSKWRGLNLLGKALGKLRDQIIDEIDREERNRRMSPHNM